MNDRVIIEGLVIRCRIGVYQWEQELTQPLRFDIEMAWDNRVAGVSDDLGDALDYQAVATCLQDALEDTSIALIESVAERCAALIREKFSVCWLRLKVAKSLPQLSMECAAVVIERGELAECSYA